MQELKNKIEKLIDTSKYEEACELVKEKFNIEYECKFLKNDYHFNNDTNMQKIIKQLNESCLPHELCDEDLGFKEVETLYDTEEFITPEENSGQSTIEVYEEKGLKMIWDNSIKL